MTRVRVPFPWETTPDPLADAGGVDLHAGTREMLRALVPDDAPCGRAVSGGELNPVEGRSVRDTRDILHRDMLRDGASAEWAAERSARAVRNWDRGVRTGSIRKPGQR